MKKILVTSLILFFGGLAVFAAGWYAADGDVTAVNGSVGPFEVRVGRPRGFGGEWNGAVDYGTRSYDYEPMDIRRVELSADNGNVILTKSPDPWVHLICEESDTHQYKVTHSGKTLTVAQRSDAAVLFGLWDGDLNIELQLPEKHQCEIVVEASNGDVTADGLWLHRQDSGADLSSTNGKVTAAGLRARDVMLNSGNGAVTADSVECVSLAVSGDNGRVRVDGADCGTLEAASQNGSVTLLNVIASERVYARSDNGSVTVDRIDAPSVELRSTNGSVTGTVAGSGEDYTIRSGSGNGKSNLPAEWGRGPRQLEVYTQNGSIDIRFSEE